MNTGDFERAAARLVLLRAVRLRRMNVDDALAGLTAAVAALQRFDDGALPVIDVARIAADRIGLAAPLPSLLRRQAD